MYWRFFVGSQFTGGIFEASKTESEIMEHNKTKWTLWRPKVLADTVFPFLTISAILGFGVFQYPIGRPRLLISVIYAIIFSCVFSGAFVKVIVQPSERGQSTQPNNTLNRHVIYVNQATTVAAQMINFWCAKVRISQTNFTGPRDPCDEARNKGKCLKKIPLCNKLQKCN